MVREHFISRAMMRSSRHVIRGIFLIQGMAEKETHVGRSLKKVVNLKLQEVKWTDFLSMI